MKITVIGDGGWGTTLAVLLSKKGYDVIVWSISAEYAKEMNETHINRKFLPGIHIPKKVFFTNDADMIKSSDVYVVSVPCQFLRKTISSLAGNITGTVVSVVKGIENDTLKRPSQILKEILQHKNDIAVLSGPTIAIEIARELPATCVISADNEEIARKLRDVFSTDRFRVYSCSDVIGVELGGALKNIIAISAGIADGLGFGINTKAAILTRGLAEISRLGVQMGALKETFVGSSGVGDLATTCMSLDSRNRSFGEQIAKGNTLDQILKNTQSVVEGIATTESAYQLANEYNVDMPITNQIYEVIYNNKDPKLAVKELMTRTLKDE